MRAAKPKRSPCFELFRWIVWAQRKAGEDWLRERELTFEQGFVLGYLLQHPGAMQRDIAQAGRTSPASVSSLLQGLQRRGFVTRRLEDGDERSKRVYATPTATELIAGLDTAMAVVDESILAPLNQTERATLLALLQKLTAKLPHQPRPSVAPKSDQ